MKRTEDRRLSGRNGPALMALLVCLVTMLIAPVAQPALGYTNMWQPPYIDRMLVGGTATTTASMMPPGVIDAPGCGLMVDTLRMAAHLQSSAMGLTNGGVVHNPVIWSLDGAVTLYVGVPNGINSTTLIPIPTAGDSHGLQLWGTWSSFTVYKSGTADSAAATTYAVVGMTGPMMTYERKH